MLTLSREVYESYCRFAWGAARPIDCIARKLRQLELVRAGTQSTGHVIDIGEKAAKLAPGSKAVYDYLLAGNSGSKTRKLLGLRSDTYYGRVQTLVRHGAYATERGKYRTALPLPEDTVVELETDHKYPILAYLRAEICKLAAGRKVSTYFVHRFNTCNLVVAGYANGKRTFYIQLNDDLSMCHEQFTPGCKDFMLCDPECFSNVLRWVGEYVVEADMI